VQLQVESVPLQLGVQFDWKGSAMQGPPLPQPEAVASTMIVPSPLSTWRGNGDELTVQVWGEGQCPLKPQGCSVVEQTPVDTQVPQTPLQQVIG